MNQKKDKSAIRKLQSVNLLRDTMGGYFKRLREATLTPSKKIAWCTSVGPVELLYSMGFEVHFPENHAAIIGSTKMADSYIPSAVVAGYSPEICSYLTSDIGAFLQKQTPLVRYDYTELPKPDVLVYNTNQCREVKYWFSFYAQQYNVPLLGIHTPHELDDITPDLIGYISKQYQELASRLKEVSGLKFDIDKFKEKIRHSHDACHLWKEVLQTAKNHPSPINFFDASIHMGPVVVMRGLEDAVNYYRSLLSELKERVSKNISAVSEERFRIYWDGMPMWFKLSSMAKLFSELKACIVASTYCNSWVFDDLDAKNPFDSSALAYSKLFIVRSEQVKTDVLEGLLSKFDVDGIIYHDAKTCPRNSNNRFGLPKRLKEKTNIPFLEIQGDLSDSRCYSESQGNIVIETFINQLEMQKN